MASTSSASRSFPTLRYLAAPFRWLFASRRRALTATAVLLAMIAAPPLWWSIQLLGLPDIGDPFDVPAFRAMTIPEDRNAVVLYRQAADQLKPLDTSASAKDETLDLDARWPRAHPAVRRWLDENREAIALYRRGTERPDALGLDGSAPDDPRSDKVRSALYSFCRLAELEASRLEEEGEMAAAWGWYRAALRAAYHMSLRGSVITRLSAQRWHGELRRRSGTWAADKRTTPAMLHHALDDVVACGAFTPSESYTLRAEYPGIDRLLDSRDPPGRYISVMRLQARFQSWNFRPSPEQSEAIVDAWRSWRREPERSLRVLRLALANWIAYYDLPPDRRPAPDLGVSGSFDFYRFGPEAPDTARILSPEALDRWLNTTYDAREIARVWNFRALRVKERADHRALVVLLASELYRRDHGVAPPSDEALVGPYLDSLPDDGVEEAPGAPASTGQE
jgi:hypothetical protein